MLIFSRSIFRNIALYFNRTISCKKMSSVSNALKPPNVLVYTDERLFEPISKTLSKCLHIDKYVIYQLKHCQILTTPWKENVALLVVYSEKLEESFVKEFIEFVKQGGKLLVLCSNFNAAGVCKTIEKKESLIKIKYLDIDGEQYSGKYYYFIEKSSVLATDNKSEPVIFKLDTDKGILIISSVLLVVDPVMVSSLVDDKQLSPLNKCYECGLKILKSILTKEFDLLGYSLDAPKPTSGYVIVDSVNRMKDLMKQLTISEISLEKSTKTPMNISQSSDLKASLLWNSDDLKRDLFDKELYYSKLESNYFGKTVVFFQVVTSTMYPAEHLSDYPGIVVIASRQISGKGRSDNKWLSPEGCAAFTLHFPLMLSTPLGQRLSVLQHMASLAVVHGLRKLPGYSDLKFSLKWPNDIYYGTDKKIGGVLVNTTIQGDVVHVYVGIGVNVNNNHPTVCVNSIVEDHNKVTGGSLLPFKVEEVIAITLTELEDIVQDFGKSGPKKFLDLYYKYWIHQDQNVTLQDSQVKATVQSIDDYGFLIVKTDEQKILNLQPDGNRFDMMKNLIVAKEL